MPSAKENFLSRITNFEKALSSPDLISRALTDVEHNQKARMLRNGMAIIGYTILEDFIKKRSGEVLKKIGASTVQFTSLPQKLQEASTVLALRGIQIRAQTLKANSEDYKTFIQTETHCISSTRNSVYEISEYSLGWDKSNLSESDVSDFLKTFSVNGGWTSIEATSSSINITLVNPKGYSEMQLKDGIRQLTTQRQTLYLQIYSRLQVKRLS